MAKVVATIEGQREGAEVFRGADLCEAKSRELLAELHLPLGLLPLQGVEEVGYNRASGFVWLRQPKGTQHVFKKIGKTVWYAPEITAFVQDRRMRRLTGVKSKELLIWVSLSDIYIDDPNSSKINFGTATGMSRSFPAAAFDLEDNEPK